MKPPLIGGITLSPKTGLWVATVTRGGVRKNKHRKGGQKMIVANLATYEDAVRALGAMYDILGERPNRRRPGRCRRAREARRLP